MSPPPRWANPMFVCYCRVGSGTTGPNPVNLLLRVLAAISVLFKRMRSAKANCSTASFNAFRLLPLGAIKIGEAHAPNLGAVQNRQRNFCILTLSLPERAEMSAHVLRNLQGIVE